MVQEVSIRHLFRGENNSQHALEKTSHCHSILASVREEASHFVYIWVLIHNSVVSPPPWKPIRHFLVGALIRGLKKAGYHNAA